MPFDPLRSEDAPGQHPAGEPHLSGLQTVLTILVCAAGAMLAALFLLHTLNALVIAGWG
jgi:hypothetical protein